jgi:hypothetical protein
MGTDMPLSPMGVTEAVVYDPALLAQAMQGLKLSIIELRSQFKETAPQTEARAVIRQKARTGTLTPIRGPQAASPTGPVALAGTGRVRTGPEMQATVAAAGASSAELEAVEGWVPLTELAAQNDKPNPRRRR